MRVIRVRACVRRVLSAGVLSTLLVLVLVLLEPPPPAGSPLRHLPVQYWLHREDFPESYTSKSCVIPPTVHEIQQMPSFWHRVTSAQEERAVLVFAAYWDERAAPSPTVRLLTHCEMKKPTLRCLFWYYDVAHPESVEASVPLDTESFRMISCTPPTSPPANSLAAVSLVTADFICGMPRNILAIQGIPELNSDSTPEMEPELRVGACLVWWRRGDAAARLLDWLQLLRYTGVHRVYLYINHNAHENVMRVVDYYNTHSELDGLSLDVMPYSSPPQNAAILARNRTSPKPSTESEDYNEDYPALEEKSDGDRNNSEAPAINADDLLPYNDCIYRAHADRLAWLAPLDINEAVIPIRDGTWSRLVSQEARKALKQLEESPDVLDLKRWWFPEMLQDIRSPTTTAVTKTALTTQSGNKYVIKIHVSKPPPLVPQGRIFTYEWRGPNFRTDGAVTGRLLSTARVVSVGARGPACAGACRVRAVRSSVARVHVFTSRCGGASRGLCRALRRVAVRDDVLWRWRRAQQEAILGLRKLHLRPHVYNPVDDE